jgi:tetratricopeptide (TPR) repeat protein
MKSSASKTANSEKSRRVVTPTPAVVSGPWKPRQRDWLLATFTAMVVAFVVYGPALDGEFLFDDNYLPFLMPGADNALKFWLGVRPFLMISYWLNYKSSGLDPYWYHAVNVIFHAVNSVLIAALVRRGLGWVGEKGWRREVLAAFSGALFLLHPIQTESVAYVSSRSETMSVFFFLCAFAVFAYRKDLGISMGRSIAVVLLYGTACTVKEHTTVLPALLLLTDYFLVTPFRFEAIRKNWRLYGLIGGVAILGLALVVVTLAKAETAGFRVKEFTWYEYLFTQFRVIWLYLRLYVAPFGQSADYEFTLSRSIVDGGAIFGLVGLLALAVLAWRYRREYPLASYGYFGFLILLAPTSSVVPIRDVAVERRLYLPFICLLFITVEFLRRWQVTRFMLVSVLAGVSVFAGVLSYQRNHVWSSAMALWEDTAQKSPNHPRPWFQLGYAQWQNGKCADAARSYEKSAKLGGNDYGLLIDWGLALECSNRPDDAIVKVREALKFRETAHAYSVIGMIEGKRGRAEEALAALGSAEKVDASFDMTYVYRGNVYMTRGQMDMAAAEFRRALALNPKNVPAQQGLIATQSPAR